MADSYLQLYKKVLLSNFYLKDVTWKSILSTDSNDRTTLYNTITKHLRKALLNSFRLNDH